MFGFIKKFFAGIAAFFSGLLGGKKSQDAPSIAPKTKKGKGYFLELDETGNTKPAAIAKSSEAPKLESPSPAKAPEPVKAAVATLERPKAEPAAEAKKPEPAKAPAASENGKVKVEAQPNPPAPANNGKAQSDPTFAPNYLLPTASNSRRRPGPSMDMFRDMARQVKTPS
jgi:outer membrane biosynthesis protein TonB